MTPIRFYLSKDWLVKTKLHRQFQGKQQNYNDQHSKYYISILVDDGKSLPQKEQFTRDTTVGIDLGLIHFLTISTGMKVDNPRHLKSNLKRLKREQRRLSRKQDDSNNYKKQEMKISGVQ